MTAINTDATHVGDPELAKRKALHKTATQLEGMFARQLLSSMRATVPSEDVLNGGAGEDMFTSMMDEHVADTMPAHWQHGFTDTMVKQLLTHAATPPVENSR